MHILFFGHSSSNNDKWNGFDNNFESPTQSYQGNTSDSNSSIKKQNRSEKIEKTEKSDFSSLDVKASKPKTTTTKTKSIEDDAWNLLNN